MDAQNDETRKGTPVWLPLVSRHARVNVFIIIDYGKEKDFARRWPPRDTCSWSCRGGRVPSLQAASLGGLEVPLKGCLILSRRMFPEVSDAESSRINLDFQAAGLCRQPLTVSINPGNRPQGMMMR